MGKRVFQNVALLVVMPLWLLYLLMSLVADRDGLFASFSQCLSLLPGKIGSFVRVAFYRLTMSDCSADCIISFGCLFSQRDTSIAAGVYIGPNCNIGSVSIGPNCLLGSGVHLLSGKGQHSIESLDIPVKDQGGVFEKISIGEDSWIGNNAVVMDNVGNHCVVGSGAVVSRAFADYSIVGGNPAVLIKSRT